MLNIFVNNPRMSHEQLFVLFRREKKLRTITENDYYKQNTNKVKV